MSNVVPLAILRNLVTTWGLEAKIDSRCGTRAMSCYVDKLFKSTLPLREETIPGGVMQATGQFNCQMAGGTLRAVCTAFSVCARVLIPIGVCFSRLIYVHRFAHKGKTTRLGPIRFVGRDLQRMLRVKVELPFDEG